MKNLLSLILVFISVELFSQGQIISITIDPPSPTTADSVTVYVELQFSSGGCSPDNQFHSTIANTTSATSHHCLGMLTVICPYTDTFELGYLQAGVHQFDFVLTSGGAPSPCTPGIVPDDEDGVSFTVSSGVGIFESELNNLVKCYPNPATDFITFSIDPSVMNSNLVITDAAGREIYTLANISASQITISDIDFSAGLYFYQLRLEDKVISSGKMVKE